MASYDVQTRLAKPGQPLGAWTDRGTATTVTRLSVPAAAGSEWYVRLRAPDLAGNVSRWSGARCTSVIFDDRALAVSDATAKAATLVLRHTVTVLRRRGAAATLAKPQRGSTVAVWVLRGPRQGPVDVRVGTHRLARLATAAPTRRRALVLLPMTTRGAVRFVAAGEHPVGVEGFAVER